MARRWSGVLLIMLVALLGIAGAWWWFSGQSDSQAGPEKTLPPCFPLDTPAGALGYAEALEAVRSPDFVGADVGLTAQLADGRLVWIFGDTTRSDGQGPAVRNSMLIDEGDCRTLVGSGGGPVIPDRADGVGYWPTSALARGPRLYVTAQRVRADGSEWGFVNLGPSIAVFDVVDRPRLISLQDLGPDDTSRARVGWGAALMDGGDGWWYVYGTSHDPQDESYGWSVRVARTRPDDLARPDTWRYWDGRDWSADEQDAAEVISGQGGVAQTFSVIAPRLGSHDPSFYAVSKRDGDLGTDLALWPAPAPWGPFSDPVTVGRIPNDDSPSILRYMPLAHPTLTGATPHSIVVSVSRNTVDPGLLAESPSLYRPFFVDVTLPPLPSDRLVDPWQGPR